MRNLLIIVLFIGMAGLAVIGYALEAKHEAVTLQLCGMSTGVSEYVYSGGELYCRTSSGDLERPVTARFYQTRTDEGFGYAPIPLKRCLK